MLVGCFIGTGKAKLSELSMWSTKIKERVGENSFLFIRVSIKPTLAQINIDFFHLCSEVDFCLPFGKMWKFLVAQGCKLAWKVCLWENAAHVFNGSFSYRYLEFYLFHLVNLWNVYSGKSVYQAHPWKWAGFTSNPDFVQLCQDVVSWAPGVVFLSLCHQACPRHELTVVSILLLYWLKKKLSWHYPAQRCQRYWEEENLPLGKCFYSLQ